MEDISKRFAAVETDQDKTIAYMQHLEINMKENLGTLEKMIGIEVNNKLHQIEQRRKTLRGTLLQECNNS